MQQRVEGVYPNTEEALRAVDRLRNQGYDRDSISIEANEEVRNSFASSVDTEPVNRTSDTDRSNDDNDDDSFWESVKDAFTMGDSYDEAQYKDPNYDSANDPVYEHREAISQGSVAVLVREDTDVEGSMSRMNVDPDDERSDRKNNI